MVYRGVFKNITRAGAFLVLYFLCLSVMAMDSPRDGAEALDEDDLRAVKVRDSIVGSNPDQNFSLYKLNYAILNDEDLMLQYSFKYRVIDELYLAYTNLVLWDIYDGEQPAIDNNFMPELFYRFIVEKDWLVSFDAGWFHRSNGTSGPDSRAWDRWQLRMNTQFEPGGKQVLMTYAIFEDIKKSSKNEDINEFSGPWELNIVTRNIIDYKGNELDLAFKLVPGDGWAGF